MFSQPDDDHRMSSPFDIERARSLSGSSAMLLQRRDGRVSAGLDSATMGGLDSSAVGTYSSRAGSSYSPTIMGGGGGGGRTSSQLLGSESPRSSMVGSPQPFAADPYYRPPRQRRRTVDTTGYLRDVHSPDIAEEEGGGGGGDEDITDAMTTTTMDPPPSAAYMQAPGGKDDMIDGVGTGDPRQSPSKDYAVREVDFYYGGGGGGGVQRGPPLSSHTGTTRRLKTGPADPTGPVSSATGWVRGLFNSGNKSSREKGKGFEVVRGGGRAPAYDDDEPYRDYSGDDDDAGGGHSRQVSGNPLLGSYHDSDGEDDSPDGGGGDIELNDAPAPLHHHSDEEGEENQHLSPNNNTTTTTDDGIIQRLPFNNGNSNEDQQKRSFSTTRSAASSSDRHEGYVLHTPPRQHDIHPSGVGFVAQYPVSDQIHHRREDSEEIFGGTAAEVVVDHNPHPLNQHPVNRRSLTPDA